MSVAVSLQALVLVAGTRALWPERFGELVAKLDDEPNDKAQWGVIADWCDENGEPALADAFRYVSRRVFVEARNARVRAGAAPEWALDGLPRALVTYSIPPGDRSTLPGLAATLVPMLAQAREDVKT